MYAIRSYYALRDAEARYRALVELSPDAIIVHSAGLIEYANPAAARLLRATPAQLAGTRIEDMVHPDDHARLAERLRFLAVGPGASAFETASWLTAVFQYDSAGRKMKAFSNVPGAPAVVEASYNFV